MLACKSGSEQVNSAGQSTNPKVLDARKSEALTML